MLPFVSNLSTPRIIYALLSSAQPVVTMTEEITTLVFAGVVFQYLESQKRYTVHSEWLASSLQPETTTMGFVSGISGIGPLQVNRNPSSMKNDKEEWVFYIPHQATPPVQKSQVQSIFNAMYTQRLDVTTEVSKQLISALQTQVEAGKKVLSSLQTTAV